jgi:hypothetical protein
MESVPRRGVSQQLGMFSPIHLCPQLQTLQVDQLEASEESLIDNPC